LRGIVRNFRVAAVVIAPRDAVVTGRRVRAVRVATVPVLRGTDALRETLAPDTRTPAFSRTDAVAPRPAATAGKAHSVHTKKARIIFFIPCGLFYQILFYCGKKFF
jgi:hypothetical protein